jgi:hypothetical protein
MPEANASMGFRCLIIFDVLPFHTGLARMRLTFVFYYTQNLAGIQEGLVMSYINSHWGGAIFYKRKPSL